MHLTISSAFETGVWAGVFCEELLAASKATKTAMRAEHCSMCEPCVAKEPA